MATVSLRDLTKVYPEKKGPGVCAVKNVTLDIRHGEFMVLVGPSGCGKSTILRMIAGLEDISSGTVAIDGRVVNHVLPKDRDIAMVFQNYALYPHMSVFENMAFGLKLRRLPQELIEERVATAATMLGLNQLLHRKPRALSGGQLQRVALGRAIVRQPKVFLFDEPLSNLDAKMRVSTRAEISRLHRHLGATMIYVTHDQVEAMTMGDRICVIRDGSIVQVATPLELYNHPGNLYVAGFIGSPPMNLFKGTVRLLGSAFCFVEDNPTSAPICLPLPPKVACCVTGHLDKPVYCGIRPENVHESTILNPGCTFVARVDVAEPMGAETFLHLHTGANVFVARFNSADRFIPGQSILVGFDADRIHLFDAVTEQILR
jgi:multiple sugar transport system ATP-binding protein